MNKIPIQPISIVDNVVYSPITIVEERMVNIEGVAKNYYIANNIGELRNIHGQLVTPRLINSGYYIYSLYTGYGKTSAEKYKRILAHRLFMQVFCPIPNFEDYVVDHKDSNKANNCLSNLEYVTQAENNRRKYLTRPNDGIHAYNSMFNMNQLEIIVREIDNGTQYKYILSMIGVPDSKLNRDYIGNIKRGITYKNEVKMIREKISSTTIES